MPVVRAVICALLILPLVSTVVRAETSATITSDDLKTGMTATEVEELSQMMDDLRKLREAGLRYPKGDIRRRAQLLAFEKLKRERDERFGYARGLVGQTITLHGEPPPSVQEVVASVMEARKSGSGDGILHPHWVRDPEGALRGSAEAPSMGSGLVGSGLINPDLPPADGPAKGCLFGIPDGGVCN